MRFLPARLGRAIFFVVRVSLGGMVVRSRLGRSGRRSRGAGGSGAAAGGSGAAAGGSGSAGAAGGAGGGVVAAGADSPPPPPPEPPMLVASDLRLSIPPASWTDSQAPTAITTASSRPIQAQIVRYSLSARILMIVKIRIRIPSTAPVIASDTGSWTSAAASLTTSHAMRTMTSRPMITPTPCHALRVSSSLTPSCSANSEPGPSYFCQLRKLSMRSRMLPMNMSWVPRESAENRSMRPVLSWSSDRLFS